MTRNQRIRKIAKQHLGIETLEERKSDDLDFHEVAVFQVTKALDAAYRAGQADGGDETELFDAMREQMSPQAIAAIVVYLQPARTNNPEADRQVRWFADQLVELLGGTEQHNRLSNELGL